MPIPIVGAIGFGARLFGGVIKKIRSNIQVKKAKKAEQRAKDLAQRAQDQFNQVGNKLFSVNDETMTAAQKAVFNNPTQENILPSDNKAGAVDATGIFKKYGVYLGAVVVILFLFKFLKR